MHKSAFEQILFKICKFYSVGVGVPCYPSSKKDHVFNFYFCGEENDIIIVFQSEEPLHCGGDSTAVRWLRIPKKFRTLTDAIILACLGFISFLWQLQLGKAIKVKQGHLPPIWKFSLHAAKLYGEHGGKNKRW